MTECLLYINKCKKYVEYSMHVLIKEVHVVIRTKLKTLGTLLFTFLFKKRFKVTIHFMDSHNHVFISHPILRKITAFIWKTFLIVIRNGIFIYLKHCFSSRDFTSSSLLLNQSYSLDENIDKAVKPVTTLTTASCTCLNFFVSAREHYFWSIFQIRLNERCVQEW